MNVGQLLVAAARQHPEAPALARVDGDLASYGDFAGAVARRAAHLRRAWKIERGDLVALVAPNSPTYLETLFAIWWCGAVAVPVSWKLHPREVAPLLNDFGVSVALVSEDLAGVLEPHTRCRVEALDVDDAAHVRRASPLDLTPVEPGAAAWIFSTSGTTGRAKGAVLTHANLLALATAHLADVDALRRPSSLLHVALMSHASGLFALPYTARAGRHVVPEAEAADPATIAAALSRYERTSLFVPPVLLRRLSAHDSMPDLAPDRRGQVLVGAAPVSAADLRRAVEVLGPRVWNGYGQGESPCTISAHTAAAVARCVQENDEEGLSSVGLPRSHTDVRLAAPDGDLLPVAEPGVVGEVVVRGPTVMSHYLHDLEATAATLADGWLRTGDVGSFDACGRLHLLERTKDVVIAGGVNIYPREVEDVLARLPGVRDVAVVGAADPEWGELPVAFVVADPGTNPADLEAGCLASLARFKRPRAYHLIDSLPRNEGGKVLKRELRDRLRKTDGSP